MMMRKQKKRKERIWSIFFEDSLIRTLGKKKRFRSDSLYSESLSLSLYHHYYQDLFLSLTSITSRTIRSGETRYALVIYDKNVTSPSRWKNSGDLIQREDLPALELPPPPSTTKTEMVSTSSRRPRRCSASANIHMVPREILDRLFTLLNAEELCQASRATRDWARYVDDRTLWKQLCKTKWQVDFNELHMPKQYYKDPKLMYKFMSTVWRRVRRRCQEQQRVAALATVLKIPNQSAEEIFLLCDS